MLFRFQEAEWRNGGALPQRAAGGVRFSEHGVRQGQTRQGEAARTGKAMSLRQSGRLGVIAASGRYPALQDGHPPEVRGEPDLSDGNPVGRHGLSADSGHLLGLGESARLCQGEYLIDDVGSRVGDGQLVAERRVVGEAGFGDSHSLGGPSGCCQGDGLDNRPDNPGTPVAAGDVLEHGHGLVGVA